MWSASSNTRIFRLSGSRIRSFVSHRFKVPGVPITTCSGIKGTWFDQNSNFESGSSIRGKGMERLSSRSENPRHKSACSDKRAVHRFLVDKMGTQTGASFSLPSFNVLHDQVPYNIS
jgi:hypothetical protein